MFSDYDETIQAAVATRMPAGYDWRLYKAQLWQESRFNPNAVSPAGAVGIAQFMPATWDRWSKKAGFKGAPPTDPVASIHTGAEYMAYLINEWSWPRPDVDRICLAMASYNAGLGSLLEAQQLSGNKVLYSEIMEFLPDVTGDHSTETIQYADRILKNWIDQVLYV